MSVRSERVTPTRVYNLTLDRDNVYYANGILVANCADALALTFAIPDQPAGFTMEEALSSNRLIPGYGGGNIVRDYDPFDPRRNW